MTKKTKIIVAFALTVIILASYFIGNITATTALGEQKVGHDELVAEIEEKDAELARKSGEAEQLDERLSGLKLDVASYENKLGDLQAEHDAAKALVGKKGTLEKDIAKLTDQVKAKQAEVQTLEDTKKTKQAELDGMIQEKQAELAAVEGTIKKKKDSPKTLPAGVFIVGQDIPASRYVAKAVSGSDNFVVYSESGNLKVNTILGSSEYGVPEYVFYANEGDLIENGAPTVFTPIE